MAKKLIDQERGLKRRNNTWKREEEGDKMYK